VTSQDNPNHAQVSLLIDRLKILTDPEKEKFQQKISELIGDPTWKSKMANAWHRAGYAARESTRNTAWSAARAAARNLGANSPLFPAREAARASGALVVRDLITTEDFEILIAPCRFLLEELEIIEPVQKTRQENI